MSNTEPTYPLGAASYDPTNPYSRGDVVGEVEKAPSGNTVLRVGRLLHAIDPTCDSPAWTQALDDGPRHIVLTPAERDALIATLTAHRDA